MMIKYLFAIFASMLVVAVAIGDEEPVMSTGKMEISNRTRRLAGRYERDLYAGRMDKRRDVAMDAMIRLAVYKLKRSGHQKEASDLLYEWEQQKRGIGDHKAMSEWLSKKIVMLEFIIGHDAMYSLRLLDLHTVNHGVPVVFRCIDNVDEKEYGLHFIDDYENNYRGLGPVMAYWTTFFSCVGGSWGTGFTFCAPVAMGVEYLSKTIVCPKLNPVLWDRACH